MRVERRRRVVLAITDGIGSVSRTSEQRKSGERLGIRHVGIGINEEVSATWGPASVMIRSASALGEVALSRLKVAA